MTSFYIAAERIGEHIHHIGYHNGKRFYNKTKFKPTLYIPSKDPNSPYRTIHREPVEPIQFDSMYDANDFIKKYKDVDNFTYYGMDNYVYQFLAEQYKGEIKFDSSIMNIVYLDTEVGSENGFPDPERANEEFTAITVRFRNKYYSFGLLDYTPHRPDVHYFKFKSEEDMLRKFIVFWEAMKVDLITGWNTQGFDIPYMVRRIAKILGDDWVKKLSPLRKVEERKFTGAFGKEVLTYEIRGIIHYDYIELYKKFSYSPQESYRLDHIAHVELNERKLDYSEVSSLHQLYKTNFQKYLEYNIQDVELVYKLDEKKKIIDLVLTLTYSAKCLPEDAFKQTRLWDCIIYNYLKEKNVAIPKKRHKVTSGSIIGGYVKDPQTGKFKWVVTLDATSLYPHLFMAFNIGPDTLRGKFNVFLNEDMIAGKPHGFESKLKENNLSMAANGSVYDRSYKSFMVELLELFFADRSKYKKMMLAEEDKLEDIKKELEKRGLKV